MLPDRAAPAPARPDAGDPTAAPLVGLSRRSVFIPELESLRGIAVLLVLAFHIDAFAHYPFAGSADVSIPLAFVRAGHTGVDLFFLLSGFLLSLPFLAAATGGKRVVLRDYAARRALRILPLYWSAVVVGTLLSAHQPGDLWRGVPYLFFLNSFPNLATPMHPYAAVWWSLATEAQFYLVLPLLVLLRWRSGRLLLAGLLLAYAAAYVQLVRGRVNLGSIGAQLALHNSVFGRGPLFLCGIFSAALYHRFGARLQERLAASAWFRNGAADVLLLALVVAQGLLLQWVVSIGAPRQQGAADQPWHAATGLLWAGVLLLILLAPLRTKALVSNRLLRRLGILSYSIYMIHAPLLFLTLERIRGAFPGTFSGATASSGAVLAVLALGSFALSALTYRFIERPFLVRKARYDS